MTTNLPVKCYNYRLRNWFPSFLSFEVTFVTLSWFLSGIDMSELLEIINMKWQGAKPEGHNLNANLLRETSNLTLLSYSYLRKAKPENTMQSVPTPLLHSYNRATHRYCAARTTLTLLPPNHNSALYIRTRSFRFPSASSTFKTTTTSPLKNRTNG
jgi:hypothetical protein